MFQEMPVTVFETEASIRQHFQQGLWFSLVSPGIYKEASFSVLGTENVMYTKNKCRITYMLCKEG